MFGGVVIALVEALVALTLISTTLAEYAVGLIVLLLLLSLVRWKWPRAEVGWRAARFTKPSSSGI